MKRTLARLSVALLASAALVGCYDADKTETPLSPMPASSTPAVSRPISDFVDAQGTLCLDDGNGGCFLFVPPVQNFVGWTETGATNFGSVDYAGLADAWIRQASGGTVSFNTTTAGSITEQALPDGRAEVRIDLRTTNALLWVCGANSVGGPLLFGAYADEVLYGGRTPALGRSTLTLRFINDAPGAPLPDLLQLLFLPNPSQELLQLSIRANAQGELHELAGFDEGTPGRASIVQIGILNSGFHGAVGDGFPAEQVNLQPLAVNASQ